jgi:hypothetical protein
MMLERGRRNIAVMMLERGRRNIAVMMLEGVDGM